MTKGEVTSSCCLEQAFSPEAALPLTDTHPKPSIPGYQRELKYKHKDGSYSAFGDQTGEREGNTW